MTPGWRQYQLDVPLRLINDVLPRTVSTMQLETKFLRLRTPVTIGSRFGDWDVTCSAAGPDTG
jgi:hypothetical protein